MIIIPATARAADGFPCYADNDFATTGSSFLTSNPNSRARRWQVGNLPHGPVQVLLRLVARYALEARRECRVRSWSPAFRRSGLTEDVVRNCVAVRGKLESCPTTDRTFSHFARTFPRGRASDTYSGGAFGNNFPAQVSGLESDSRVEFRVRKISARDRTDVVELIHRVRPPGRTPFETPRGGVP
jgi:hypothetical protein